MCVFTHVTFFTRDKFIITGAYRTVEDVLYNLLKWSEFVVKASSAVSDLV